MEVISGAAAATERLSSQNLRDLLGIKEECHHNGLQQSTSHGGGLTLEAVLREKRPPPPPPPAEPLQRIQSNRTLLDIIREDQTPTLAAGRTDSRRSWRHLKNKIRLRRRGGGAAPFSHPARFNPNTNSAEPTEPHIPTDPETSSDSNHRVAAAEVQEHGGGPAEEPPVRMSLMSLLAENDRQMGLEGSAYIMDEDIQEGEEEDDGAPAGGGGGAAYNSCCVCMVRHKGAAFIPCGHTFCRLCSRELWVQRGNCPLCNNYIVEILDIF